MGGSLARMAPVCKKCRFRDNCNHKLMIGEQYLENAAEVASQEADAPILRDTMTINVGGSIQTVYKDDIEKEIYKNLRIPLNMEFGA